MPLNPSPQDKTGIVLANYDGTGDARNYPDGDKPDAGGGEYQLLSGQYSPSRMPLQWLNPSGDETSRSAFLWSHSEFDYVRRVTVIGGSPPYYFYLESPVAGVTFTRQAPSWNPNLFLWGKLKIDHTQFTSGSKEIPLGCIDQEGTLISLSLTVTVDDSKFVVMHKGVGSSSATGALADPYNDLVDIYTTDRYDDTHAGKILVARESVSRYIVDNFDNSIGSFRLSQNKISSIIPYPGEVPEYEMLAGIGPWFDSGDSVDYYFGEGIYHGSENVEQNVTRMFSYSNVTKRSTFDNVTFDSPAPAPVESTNNACIYTPNTPRDNENISLVDCQFKNLPASGKDYGMTMFYNVSGIAVVGGSLDASGSTLGLYVKQNCDKVMLGGVNLYSSEAPSGARRIYVQNGDAGLRDPVGAVQVIGCKAFVETSGRAFGAGDSNQQWGTIYADRLTLVGTAGFNGGDDSLYENSGNVFLSDSIVLNDDTPPANALFTKTNVVESGRSQINTYLNSAGDVIDSYQNYGTQGANFVAPGGAT